MAITYEYFIKGISTDTARINKQEFPNTVRAIHWDLIGTHEDGTVEKLESITTFVKFMTRHTGSFTPFSELTEEQVIGWIKNTVSGSNKATNYWDHIESRITRDIQAKRGSYSNLLEDELPWKPNPTTYNGPNGNGGA